MMTFFSKPARLQIIIFAVASIRGPKQQGHRFKSHLFTVALRTPSGPEEMGADTDPAALVRLLEQLGGGEGTLRP